MSSREARWRAGLRELSDDPIEEVADEPEILVDRILRWLIATHIREHFLSQEKHVIGGSSRRGIGGAG